MTLFLTYNTVIDMRYTRGAPHISLRYIWYNKICMPSFDEIHLFFSHPLPCNI
jgi:hypothetical protein